MNPVSKLKIDPAGLADGVVDESEEAQEAQTSSVVIESDEDGDEPAAQLPPRAKLNDDGSVTLPLTKAITLKILAGGKERQEVYSDLVFHEMTGLDLRLVAQEKDDMKRTVLTLARATRMPAARMNVLFDRLSQRDVKGATSIVEYFQE